MENTKLGNWRHWHFYLFVSGGPRDEHLDDHFCCWIFAAQKRKSIRYVILGWYDHGNVGRFSATFDMPVRKPRVCTSSPRTRLLGWVYIERVFSSSTTFANRLYAAGAGLQIFSTKSRRRHTITSPNASRLVSTVLVAVSLQGGPKK